MKLISLEMENFRQHSCSKIAFNDGITLISGTNGSGKSTVLEAISWAIYGTEAARGNKNTIKWNKAPARSKVGVVLTFELDNERYRVNREFNKSEVFLNDNEAPVAVGQDEITKYLTDRLGMSRVEFFNTYFTGQKELNFLGNQKATERKNFISKVLNYEKVRTTQEKIRVAKNSLNSEITGIKQGLGSLETLEEEKNQALQMLDEYKKTTVVQKDEFSGLSLQISEVEPEWEKIKEVKDKHDKSSQELGFLSEKAEFLSKNIENRRIQLKSLELKLKELNQSSSIEAEYRELSGKISELEKLQEKAAEKQRLTSRQENLSREITEKQVLLNEVIASGKEKKVIIDGIPDVKDGLDKLNKALQELEQELNSNRREKEVLINQKQLETAKYKKQLAIIEDKGENGVCPTCERPLSDEFNKVIGQFKSNIDLLNSEITVLSQELQALTGEPEAIAEHKKLKTEKEKDYNELNKFEGQYQEERNRYKLLKLEIDTKTAEIETIKKELAGHNYNFNIEELKSHREAIIPLRKKYEEVLKLKAETTNLETVKNELDKDQNAFSEVVTKKTNVETSLNQLKYSEDDYLKLKNQVTELKEQFYKSKEALIKSESEQKNIESLIDRIASQEKAYKEKLRLLQEKQDDLNHLIELDKFYGAFLDKLNDRARPEISELASEYLHELTDGRYSELEINDKYEINLIDDGEIKPVISGGEEDIANLCVRIAISRMIAQRSGKALTLLILDEVFGSLDESRRNNVMSLLNRLIGNFEQVIVITHIDEVKEGLDNIIYVEYDEESGCSTASLSPVI